MELRETDLGAPEPYGNPHRPPSHISKRVLSIVKIGPLLPTAMTFSRRSTYSQRAICMARCLFTDGMAGSRRCRALYGREACSPDPALHHAMMVVYQLKLI